MRIKKVSRCSWLFCYSRRWRRAEKYQVYLSAMPYLDANQPLMTGKGTATATLEGDTLTISDPSRACRDRRRKHIFH